MRSTSQAVVQLSPFSWFLHANADGVDFPVASRVGLRSGHSIVYTLAYSKLTTINDLALILERSDVLKWRLRSPANPPVKKTSHTCGAAIDPQNVMNRWHFTAQASRSI
jgi:hypothetical protein